MLLCVLWVQSYTYDSSAKLHGLQWRADFSDERQFVTWLKLGAMHFATALPNDSRWTIIYAANHNLGFGYLANPNSAAVRIPMWALLFLSIAASAAPWLPFKRFSLRTLLIATTLVAVVLGLFVWLSRTS